MKLNKSLILAGTALIGIFASTAVMAQSTSTQEVEKTTEVVVKSNRNGAGPINKETGTKSKAVIGQDFISGQAAGQTITETLNVVPGVNFTNNDPYGSSGGDIFIRGLDNSRISLTFDGVQLNDAGNYAIYTNQQLDPELIETASVITGASDVDSLTASATGGTVNYTTRKTRDEFGAMVQLSGGSFDYKRIFALVDTGTFTKWGTQAWFAVSDQNYKTFTDEPNIADGSASLKKRQYNFSVYQPMMDNGSFVSVSGHYNENRNAFIFGQSEATFASRGKLYNSINRGNINPSNTGNIRIKSKWVLSDTLTLTVDPSYQYVLANGGGNSSINEKTGAAGFIYKNFIGVDLNGDGALTTVTIYRPNTTQTDRIAVQSALIWKFSDTQLVRATLSMDRARTRQTGEAVLSKADGSTPNVFGAKDSDSNLALIGLDGSTWQRRDRFSKANVDVFALEYRGKFFDDALSIVAGVKSQKMERELHQNCYSKIDGSGSFNPFCTTEAPTSTNANGTVNFASNSYKIKVDGVDVTHTDYIKPYTNTVSFDKILPSLGVTYKIGEFGQLFASYSENLSSPRTDNYYAVTLKNNVVQVANPNPETTKGIEGGYRYNSSALTASVSVWSKTYNDRIVSSYDADTDTFFDRNVGTVDMKGAEASLAFKPMANLSVITGATYTDTNVNNNIPNGTDTSGNIIYIPTAGKQLAEIPDWMFNLGATYDLSETFHVTLIGKYVGERWGNDINTIKAPSYTTWNLGARYDLQMLKKGTFLQLNVINLTDEYYYGNISTSSTGAPSYNLGAPRTVMLTLRTQF